MLNERNLDGAIILVADDNPNNLQVIEAMLREFGCEVRIALDGEAAVKSALGQPPDLILLDIHMPKLDGYGACTQLKENEKTRSIPVLFASAMNDEFNKVKGFSLGAVDYITKPLQLEELRARVGVHLQISRQRDKLILQAEELKVFNNSMMGREMRILELKKEANELSRLASRELPYPEIDE